MSIFIREKKAFALFKIICAPLYISWLDSSEGVAPAESGSPIATNNPIYLKLCIVYRAAISPLVKVVNVFVPLTRAARSATHPLKPLLRMNTTALSKRQFIALQIAPAMWYCSYSTGDRHWSTSYLLQSEVSSRDPLTLCPEQKTPDSVSGTEPAHGTSAFQWIDQPRDYLGPLKRSASIWPRGRFAWLKNIRKPSTSRVTRGEQRLQPLHDHILFCSGAQDKWHSHKQHRENCCHALCIISRIDNSILRPYLCFILTTTRSCHSQKQASFKLQKIALDTFDNPGKKICIQ